MSDRIISIPRFGGMITNPHQEDIPDTAGVFAGNIDPQTEGGVLRGMLTKGSSYTANGTAIPNVSQAVWIKYESSGSIKYDLVYIDKSDDDVVVIEDFYAVEASRTFNSILAASASYDFKTIKVFDNAAQIGVYSSATATRIPFTVFRLLNSKSCFNSNETITAGVKSEYARCYNLGTGSGGFDVTSLAFSGGAGYFAANILYSYGVSIVYDGIQESNLSKLTGSSGATSTTITVNITANAVRTAGAGGDITNLDARVTAIKLYRAESSDTTSANLGLHRLIATIDINTGTSTVNWVDPGAGNDYTFAYVDSGDYEGGATFEEETGIPETLTRTWVDYQLNEIGGGYHWCANPYVPNTSTSIDWSRYIFRSKKFRPNMFDWTAEGDFLTLPEIPTALAYYNNKLYAFSTNTLYRINPELLVVEDSFAGKGCSNAEAVTVTKYGMFFCNLNGAYRLIDNQILNISDPISETSTRLTGVNGWKTVATNTLVTNAGKFIVLYEAYKRMVLFIGVVTGTTVGAFAFYEPTGEWFYQILGTLTWNSAYGGFNGKDGEVYISTNANNLTRAFAGATYETTAWVSKEFTLGEPSQNKLWEKLKWDNTNGTGTTVVKYGTNGSDVTASGTTATNDANINTYKKSFQVYAVTTGNAKIDSLDILVRPLAGKR